MRLLLHQFRKDFRQTWIIWLLWLFFVLVQFGLAAWTVNPGDLLASGVYGQVIAMVPTIHAILLFVLIPLLVFQETPVGTTASWLSRPMPPLTVLGSKLISFGILVLVPLLGQCAVLAAHHVTAPDVALAGLEIALKELTWIALATGLAVLCPNFGTFLVAAAGVYVIQYFSGWIWNWIALLQIATPSLTFAGSMPFLGASRLVASDLVCIAFGFGVVLLQYLTRRTRVAILLGIMGLIASAIVNHYWAWDFVGLMAKKSMAAPVPTVPAPGRILPGGNRGVSESNDPRSGTGTRSLSMQVFIPGVSPDETLSLESQGGEQVFPDGNKLQLKPDLAGMNEALSYYYYGLSRSNSYGGLNLASVDAAIDYFPILNQQFSSNIAFEIPSLFSVDSKTFQKVAADLGTGTFQIKGSLSGYRITAEIPLERGAFFSDASKRTTLTEIQKTDDGLNLVLRQRSLKLLLAPGVSEDVGSQAVYLLVNRKRGEALGVDNRGGGERYNPGWMGNGPLSAFQVSDSQFEVFTPIALSFHPPQLPPQPLPVPINDAWVADAVLIRLEPAPHGDFTATLPIPDFALDGHTLSDSNSRSEGPDLEALEEIHLPAQPTRSDVWRYITRILYASAGQRNTTKDDPQVDLLMKVGPTHAGELLIATTAFNGADYPWQALKQLDLQGQEEVKKMIFRLLATRNQMIELVILNHWEGEAKPMLLARVNNRRPGESIDSSWLDALALFHDDPKVKQAILDLLPSQQDVIRIVIANHWEEDAKPILISVIARTKPGSRIDDSWIQVLDSFHDDSKVKAMLLRALPSNQNAIETVVENHWEADAKPILLETLNKAKPGESIDSRWFGVLSSLTDQTGVKEAVLRVLPFCPNAIETIVANHWEGDAKPVMLETLNKAKPGMDLNDHWFGVLATLPDQTGVHEAVLRVLPFAHEAIETVIRGHWETEAYPVILETLAKARKGDSFAGGWFDALNAVAGQPGVKEAVLALLPKLPNAARVVIDNHWEVDAKPVILAAMNKAKPGDSIESNWYTILGAVPDQSGIKEAVLHILPFTQNAANFVIQNHWEDEARPLVIAALASAKAKDNFNNIYVGIAAATPRAVGVKEGILRILPRNSDVIEFVLQNHWEVEAKPILIRKMATSVLGQDISPRWVKALAYAKDPTVYPMLLAYAGRNITPSSNNWELLEALRPLPAKLVIALVERKWTEFQETDEEHGAYGPVASWGLTVALDRAAVILSLAQESDKAKASSQDRGKYLARNAFATLTPAPDGLLDADLIAWWTANKAGLGYDPGLARYVPHPQAVSLDQSWPSPADIMKALGQRAANGDATAFDEIETILARAVEGIDPKLGANKIRTIRDRLASAAFEVFKTDVAKNPALLANVDAANRLPALRPCVVEVYGRAAQEGNIAALQALLHYQEHQWELADVVRGLGGAMAKGNAEAIAFAANLPADPSCTPLLLDRASGQLQGAANGGNTAAQAAFRTLRKARAQM